MNDVDFLKLVRSMSVEEIESKLPFIVELTRIIAPKLENEEKKELTQK